MKSDYSYSPAVYTNFPWIELSDKQKDILSDRSDDILSSRKLYPDDSLSDLYDPLSMPPKLRAAHEANDKAVLKAYGLSPKATEQEIVEHLFKMYEKLTKGER